MVFFTLSINETDLRVGLSMWRFDINSSHVTFFNSPVTPGRPGFLYREGSVVIKSPISYSLCGFSVYFPVPVRDFSFSRVRSFRPSCLLSSPHIASALTGWGLKMARLLSHLSLPETVLIWVSQSPLLLRLLWPTMSPRHRDLLPQTSLESSVHARGILRESLVLMSLGVPVLSNLCWSHWCRLHVNF